MLKREKKALVVVKLYKHSYINLGAFSEITISENDIIFWRIDGTPRMYEKRKGKEADFERVKAEVIKKLEEAI